MRRTAAVLRAPLVVAALTVPADYEDGTPSSETAIGFNTCCPHSIGVTTTMPRTGRFALRSHLRYGDPAVEVGGTRAESHTLGHAGDVLPLR